MTKTAGLRDILHWVPAVEPILAIAQAIRSAWCRFILCEPSARLFSSSKYTWATGKPVASSTTKLSPLSRTTQGPGTPVGGLVGHGGLAAFRQPRRKLLDLAAIA